MATKIDENINPQSAALAGLIKDLGINTLSKNKQDELLIKMTEVLLKRIFLETMEKLGEQGRERYEKIIEGEVTPEQMEEFFMDNIKDYDKMVERVIEEFKNEMVTGN
ncbi:MAG TPA: hypothetical protein P5548_02110 [Candidatus Moranbacteria bacterium]|nr:hypothetical protein [Candidatus Moranbacteria bacterium]HRZ33667.1 hypothetical protein [Candidatus Moranbacteria bacterium]